MIVLVAPFATSQEKSHGNWPQGPGPNGTFHINSTTPVEWSVVFNENINWKITLPETGQSAVTVWGDRLFFSTIKPVKEKTNLASTIVAYCCDSSNGKVLWTREIEAEYALKISSPFADSSAIPAVTDGERVCFFNASGKIVCYDMDGKELWQRETIPARRCNPFMLNQSVVYVKQGYGPMASGVFQNKGGKYNDRKFWGQVQALNMKTGEISWTSSCGVFMGSIPLLSYLDGKPVLVVGRGGGHGPPEKPSGVSLIDGSNGKELWSYSIGDFHSNQSMSLYKGQAVTFTKNKHLWIDARTGKLKKEINYNKGTLYLQENDEYVKHENEAIVLGAIGIVLESNLVVGDYHYFRTYSQFYLGRVHLVTGKVEYIELPVQIKRTAENKKTELLWGGRRSKNVHKLAFRENDMKNSRGILVMGDYRSKGNGWGHHATALPMVVGEHMYVPTMSGTVYVIKWNSEVLNGDAVVAINDLGPVGKSWSRASLSTANGKIYAHTIREVICVGK